MYISRASLVGRHILFFFLWLQQTKPNQQPSQNRRLVCRYHHHVVATIVSHSPPKRFTPPTKKKRTCRSTTVGQQQPTATRNDSVPIEIVLCFPSCCSVKKQVKIKPGFVKKAESSTEEESSSNYDGSSLDEEPTDNLSFEEDFSKDCYDQGGVMPIDELSDVDFSRLGDRQDWLVPYDDLPSILCKFGCHICLE